MAKSGLKVFPVPAINQITVSFDGYAIGTTDIIITNQVGQEVARKKVSVSEGINSNNIDVTALKTGVYFVKVNNGKELQTKKVVITK